MLSCQIGATETREGRAHPSSSELVCVGIMVVHAVDAL